MPLPLTVSCFSKIQIGFTFLVLAHLGSPGQRSVKRECVGLFVTRWKAKPDCGPLGYPSMHDNKLLLTGQLICSPASIESGNLFAVACACAAQQLHFLYAALANVTRTQQCGLGLDFAHENWLLPGTSAGFSLGASMPPCRLRRRKF